MAFRPLTVAELCAATGVEFSHNTSGENMMMEQIRFCGHLLLLTQDGELQLVHLSLKEYLQHIPTPTTSAFTILSLKAILLRIMAFMLSTYLLSAMGLTVFAFILWSLQDYPLRYLILAFTAITTSLVIL